MSKPDTRQRFRAHIVDDRELLLEEAVEACATIRKMELRVHKGEIEEEREVDLGELEELRPQLFPSNKLLHWDLSNLISSRNRLRELWLEDLGDDEFTCPGSSLARDFSQVATCADGCSEHSHLLQWIDELIAAISDAATRLEGPDPRLVHELRPSTIAEGVADFVDTRHASLRAPDFWMEQMRKLKRERVRLEQFPRFGLASFLEHRAKLREAREPAPVPNGQADRHSVDTRKPGSWLSFKEAAALCQQLRPAGGHSSDTIRRHAKESGATLRKGKRLIGVERTWFVGYLTAKGIENADEAVDSFLQRR